MRLLSYFKLGSLHAVNRFISGYSILEGDSLRVGCHIIELFDKFIPLRLKDALHRLVALGLPVDTNQIVIEVLLEFFFVANNKHAADTPEHSEFLCRFTNLVQHKLCLLLLVRAQLCLTHTLASLLGNLGELC